MNLETLFYQTEGFFRFGICFIFLYGYLFFLFLLELVFPFWFCYVFSLFPMVSYFSQLLSEEHKFMENLVNVYYFLKRLEKLLYLRSSNKYLQVDKLKVLSESLSSSTSKAEKRISENRYGSLYSYVNGPISLLSI